MGVYEDFMNQATLGGAATGFIQGMRDGEDRKLRRLEMEAKADAQDRDRKRQNFMDALEARSKGFKIPEGGNLYDTPASGLEYDPEYLKMKEAQANADPFGLKGLQVQGAKVDLQKKQAAAEFENVPKDKQVQVEKLSGKVADRKQIKSDLDSALTQLDDPKLSEDEKLIVGREIIKTLNSTQGQDAVGAEESKRLASLLEYKILPRIGEPGNTFGRDVKLFTTQVRNNAARVGKSAETMQAEVDGLLGRGGLLKSGLVDKDKKQAGPKRGDIVDGYEFLGGDPADQKSWKKR